jgi:hypothetical protein
MGETAYNEIKARADLDRASRVMSRERSFGTVRTPYKGEDEYFKDNRHVAGMADFESGTVVLNPYTTLSDKEKQAVILNETARLYMREKKIPPNFNLTPEQQDAFASYGGGDPMAQRETVAARILSGDPSALNYTKEQAEYVAQLRQLMGR